MFVRFYCCIVTSDAYVAYMYGTICLCIYIYIYYYISGYLYHVYSISFVKFRWATVRCRH